MRYKTELGLLAYSESMNRPPSTSRSSKEGPPSAEWEGIEGGRASCKASAARTRRSESSCMPDGDLSVCSQVRRLQPPPKPLGNSAPGGLHQRDWGQIRSNMGNSGSRRAATRVHARMSRNVAESTQTATEREITGRDSEHMATQRLGSPAADPTTGN